MEKNPLVISNKFLGILLAIFLFFHVYELINYLSAPAAYKFGTEVAGWRYDSPIHYLGSLLFELLLIGVVLGAGLSQLKIGVLLLLRGIVFVLVVIQLFF